MYLFYDVDDDDEEVLQNGTEEWSGFTNDTEELSLNTLTCSRLKLS